MDQKPSGLRTNRTRLEGRLKQIGSRLLGIANANDDVMPMGSMLNTLQGLNRDTSVDVAEFEMGVHESPFVCHDHNQPPRRFITEFLDQKRYGKVFQKFMKRVVAHFAIQPQHTHQTEDENTLAAMN